MGLGGGILKALVLFWDLELTKCCRFIRLLFGLVVAYVQSQIVTVSTAVVKKMTGWHLINFHPFFNEFCHFLIHKASCTKFVVN